MPGVVVDPACLDAYERASGLLVELGHDVVDGFDPGITEEFTHSFEVL